MDAGGVRWRLSAEHTHSEPVAVAFLLVLSRTSSLVCFDTALQTLHPISKCRFSLNLVMSATRHSVLN
jgi:hypothetical protein